MKKRIFSGQQKAQVALDAIKGLKGTSQIASRYEIHPSQINRWKTTVLEGLPGLFITCDQKDKELAEKEKLIEELYKIIGQRETELNWLKKKLHITNP